MKPSVSDWWTNHLHPRGVSNWQLFTSTWANYHILSSGNLWPLLLACTVCVVPQWVLHKKLWRQRLLMLRFAFLHVCYLVWLFCCCCFVRCVLILFMLLCNVFDLLGNFFAVLIPVSPYFQAQLASLRAQLDGMQNDGLASTLPSPSFPYNRNTFKWPPIFPTPDYNNDNTCLLPSPHTSSGLYIW